MTDNTLVPDAALYELRPLLAFVTNTLGGDGDSLVEALDRARTMEDLDAALLPLRQAGPLKANLSSKQAGKRRLFSVTVRDFSDDPQGPHPEQALLVNIGLNLSDGGEPAPIMGLVGQESGPGFIMCGGAFAANMPSSTDIKLKLLQDLCQMLHEKFPPGTAKCVFQVWSAGLSYFDDAPDLFPDAREAQQFLRHFVAGLLGDAHSLPLCPGLHMKMPTLLRLLENAYGFEKDQLAGAFVTYSGQLMKAKESMTLAKIQQQILHKHEELKDMSFFGESRNGELVLAGFPFPLLDDEGKVLDWLRIGFSADSCLFALESGALALVPGGKPQDNCFKAEGVQRLTTPGKNLSQEQAGENHALLVDMLKKFAPHAQGDKAAEKIRRDALMFLSFQTQ